MEAKRHARRGRVGSHAVGPARHDVRAHVAVEALNVMAPQRHSDCREGPVAAQHVVVAARDGDGDALEQVLFPPLRRPPVAAALLLLLLLLVVLLREDRHDRLAPSAEGGEGRRQEVVAQSRALGAVLSFNFKKSHSYDIV